MSLPWTKRWAPGDDGTILKAVDLRNLQDDIDSYITTDPTAGVVTITGTQTITGSKTFTNAIFAHKATFVNGDLAAGILTVTDTAGLTAPYMRHIKFFDNLGQEIWPDAVVCASNSWTADFTSYGTLTGTWGWIQVV